MTWYSTCLTAPPAARFAYAPPPMARRCPTRRSATRSSSRSCNRAMILNPPPDRPDIRAFDAEWARIAMMVQLAEIARSGGGSDEDFANRFAEVGRIVAENRSAGVWSVLRPHVDA